MREALRRFVRYLVLATVAGGLAPLGMTAAAAQSPLSDAAFMEAVLARFEYREIGPTRQGGRVVTFGVSSQDSKTFFVGAGPAGGWKTVNNGTTFEPVFENGNTTSIGDIAVAPSDESIVWIGTGEANIRNSTYYGDGVYKSIDGGQTWTHMGLPESHHIGRVLIHPTDPDIVYVAAQGHLYSENAERGVYKTTDGGMSWEKSLEVIVDGVHVGATEVVMSPDDPDRLYAAAYQRFRRPWTFSGAGPGSGIYRSDDGGASWEKLTAGLPGGMLGKIGLAIYPGDPRIVYARVENSNSPDPEVAEDVRRAELRDGKPPSGELYGTEIYRSDDGGDSWRKVSPDGVNIGGRDNYYGQIIVDPNDPDHLYVLSTRVDESHDGGHSWARAFRYAGDNHVLWIDPDDSDHMLLGYDYGMAITWDGGANFYHPDELSMAQLYAIGFDMDYPYNVYGGMQDFGSWKGPSTKKGRFPIRFEDWEHMSGGDGFYNRVDPSDSRWLYSESQFGDLQIVDQETGQRRGIGYRGDRDLRYNWNAPLLISPHDSNVLYHGANVVLRSSFRGADWEIVSPDLTANDADKFEGVGAVQFATTTTIDESPLVAGLLWAGTDDGNVWVRRNPGADWELLNGNIPDNPGYWVSRVEASHHEAATAYLTYTGFHHDDFRPFVYKTTDYGQTWASLATNLPERSVNVVVEDAKNPNLLFVGADRGVYASLDGGLSWWEMRNDMPVVPVHDLAIHPREGELIAGTFGRGFYITDISPLQELTAEVATSQAFLFAMKSIVQWVMPSQPAVSAQNFEGENAPHAVVVSYLLGEGATDNATIRVYDGARVINELSGPGEAGLNRVEWYMTARRPRTAQEMARWDRRQRFSAEDEEFFDYYDTVEYFLRPDDEVDKWGRSLRTRVHRGPGLTDREFFYTRVTPGEYTIELEAAGQTLRRTVSVLQDHWYHR